MRFLVGLSLLLGLALPAPAPAPDPAPAAAEAPLEGAQADLLASLAVLHRWDARRAQAWAAADVPGLRALYTGGSEAGLADVRLMRAYLGRGVVVRLLVTQVYAVKVLTRDATTVRLRVFDRVAGGEVVRDGQVDQLGSSPPARRTIELHRQRGSWRVFSVSGSEPGPLGARR